MSSPPFRLAFVPRAALLPLLFVLVTGQVVAQEVSAPLVLRDTPTDTDPQRHLLETIYNEVLYPAAARRVEKSGVYLLALPIDSTGAVTDVQDLKGLPEEAEPLELVIIGYGFDRDRPVPEETTEDPGDEALVEETLRVGRNLAEIGFRPRTVNGAPVPDTLYLSFSFSLE